MAVTIIRGDSWQHEGLSGSVQWWDETQGSKLTGVIKSRYESGDGTMAGVTLDCWMGPSLLVSTISCLVNCVRTAVLCF